MAIYKVYSQCVRVAKRIHEIDLDDVKEEISNLLNFAGDNGDVNYTKEIVDEDGDVEYEIDEDKYDEYFKKGLDFWEKNKCIGCGDYIIIECEYDEIEIPNVAGFDTDIFE